MPVDWQLKYGSSLGNTLSTNRLYNVYTKRAFNRFANEAKVWLDDPDGNLDSTFEFGTKIQLDVQTSATGAFSRNFAGYVAGSPTRDDQRTVLDVLSFDAFLRERTVNRGYSSKTVSFILEELIKELTPVQWASGANVNVNDDVTLTREYRGAKLDKVLNELSNISNTDRWGANFDNEFVFKPTGSETAPVAFTDGQYFSANISEDAKQAVFKVVLYYGDVSEDGSTDNRDAVTVEQLAQQQSLANKLGTSDPVVIELPKYYPQISSKSAATQKAKDILSRHQPLLIGELETWEAFEVEPGQITRFEYPDRGIDTQFRVAQIEHRWLEDETTVKLAENDTGVLDTLVQVSDEVARLDARGQDTTVVSDSSLDFEDEVELNQSLTITKREYSGGGDYSPPQGNEVDFVLDSGYSPPANTAVDDSIDLKGTLDNTTVVVDK
jgi:hypothetical protein